jgi:nucleoside 2-deoxyribosyltransferase
MKVYLAGPMSGMPNLNYPAFEYATAQWRDAGYEVVSPHEFFPPDAALTRRECLAVDLPKLCECDLIALLPGWETSVGAMAEVHVARALGIASWDAVSFRPMRDESVLQEAQRLVHGERQASYSHPADDYARTGRIWGAILGIADIDPRICCLMMAAVKISRETHKHKRDNLVDLAGYAECAHLVAERQAES